MNKVLNFLRTTKKFGFFLCLAYFSHLFVCFSLAGLSLVAQRWCNMKKLIIEVIYIDNTKRVEIPFEIPSRVTLPNEYPFNQNVYFGPDSGAFLGDIYIDERGKIYYLDDIIELKNGKTVYSPTKTGRYVFEFELIDQ